MKCIYTEGCICTSLTVDGKETADMSAKELRDVIKRMLDSTEDTAVLQSAWMNLMECLGEYKDLGHCDQCGDYITEYTFEL